MEKNVSQLLSCGGGGRGLWSSVGHSQRYIMKTLQRSWGFNCLQNY